MPSTNPIRPPMFSTSFFGGGGGGICGPQALASIEFLRVRGVKGCQCVYLLMDFLRLWVLVMPAMNLKAHSCFHTSKPLKLANTLLGLLSSIWQAGQLDKSPRTCALFEPNRS